MTGRRTFGLSSAVLLALGTVGTISAVGACGGDDDHATIITPGGDADALGDDTLGDDSSTPYTGPTQGGVVPLPPMDGSLGTVPTPQDGGADIVDTACCNITFVYDPARYPVADAGVDAGDGGDAGDAGHLADAGDAGDAGDGGHAVDGGDAGDASVAGDAGDAGDAGNAPFTVYLAGDAYPLSNGTMLPMTKGTNGVWTISACIPHEEYLTYRFYLGMTPPDPNGPSLPINVCDPTLPIIYDGFGNCSNTLGPVDMCSELDASTGSLASPTNDQ